MSDHLEVMREQMAALVAENCPVCASPYRKLIERDVYFEQNHDNQHVAAQYGIGDGGVTSGEILRQHIDQGHMPPKEERHYTPGEWADVRQEAAAAATKAKAKAKAADAS